MSIFPRKFHGPELKCGGPQMCPDCRERVKQAERYGILDPFEDWITEEDKKRSAELLKTIVKLSQKPKNKE